MIIGNFAPARRRLFSFGCFISVGFLSGSESVHGMLLVIGVMVAIYPLERFSGHTKEASRLPGRNTALGQPRGAGVSQAMRGHIGTQASGRRTDLNALLILLTGSPFHSTAAWIAILSRFHRRR
jgi:hypothetical protein